MEVRCIIDDIFWTFFIINILQQRKYPKIGLTTNFTYYSLTPLYSKKKFIFAILTCSIGLLLSSFSIIWKPDSIAENNTSTGVYSRVNSPHPATKLAATWEHQVLRVIDGDTIQVLIDGKPVMVRLLGIDTPETSTKRTGYKECYGKEATEYAKSLLIGKTVRIEVDATQDSKDKYGRMLAHVFFSWGRYYQEESIKNGYGFRYVYKKPTKYDSRLKVAENFAKKNNLGVWKWCNGKRERTGVWWA